MKVICEKCGAAYDIEDQRIPPEGMTMKCPKCLGSFKVRREASAGPLSTPSEEEGGEIDLGALGEAVAAPPSSQVAAAARSMTLMGPGPAVDKFFIRRHTGSVFGPFGRPTLEQMIQDGKLDGSEEISTDRQSWRPIRENPVFASALSGRQTATTSEEDLPAPKTESQRPGPPKPKPITTPPPELPDLPAPKTASDRALAELPTPAIPDLPAPKAASDRALAELPTPAIPDLPQPKMGIADLPQPREGGADLPQPSQALIDLPTPRNAPPDSGDPLSYGEVDLPQPSQALDLELGGGVGPSGDKPLDLSELDLVTPKVEAGQAAPAMDLDEADLVQPKKPLDVTGDEPLVLAGDEPDEIADLLEPARTKRASAKAAPSETKPASEQLAGARLLGLPRTVALAILGVVIILVAAVAAYVFWPRQKATKRPRRPVSKPVTPGPRPEPTDTMKVIHVPAMDLDTHAGYRAAEQAYRQQLKQKPSNASLTAARAKALLCNSYRYGRLSGLKKAKKLLARTSGTDADPEVLKARGLAALVKGKVKAARRLFKKARQIAKDDPEVQIFTGWSFLKAHHHEKAAKAFGQAIKLHGESAAAIYGLARSLSQAADRAKRLKLLKKVIKLSPRHVGAWVDLALARPVIESPAAVKDLKQLRERLGELAAPVEKGLLASGLGRLLKRIGRLDEALDELATATRLTPRDLDALLAEARARLQVGDAATAAEKLEAASKLDRTNAEVVLILVRARLMQSLPGQAEAAVARLEKRLKKAKQTGRDPHLDLAKGLLALAKNDLAKARTLFLESVSVKPRFTPGHVAYLGLLLRQGELGGMKTGYALIRRRYAPAVPVALLRLEAKRLLAEGQARRAEKVLRDALVQEPENNEILLDLGRCLWRKLKKPEEGFLILERVWKRAKSLPPAVRLLSAYHREGGDLKQAMEIFVTALKKSPSPALKHDYARLLIDAGGRPNLLKAEVLLRQLLDKNRWDHRGEALLAMVDLGLDRPKSARSRIKRALAKQPRNREYRLFQARIHAATGDSRRAAEIYARLLAENPKDPEITVLQTRLFCRFRDTRNCLKGARAVQRLVKGAVGYLLEGLGHLLSRREARAIKAFRRAVAKEARNPRAHFLLGRTYFNESEYRQAVRSLRRALDLADETRFFWPDIQYFLGMAYLQVKSRRLAAVHLKKYLATPGNPRNRETAVQMRSAREALRRL